MLKIVLINFLVFFVLVNAINMTIATVHSIEELLKDISQSEPLPDSADIERVKRAALPNYDEIDWAAIHFEEWGRLSGEYRSYIGWRRQPFSGETINVVAPYGQRVTIQPEPTRDETVYFFGGSTMWGTGANDAATIPSLFSNRTGARTENFGESGYNAHQGLLMLIQLIQDGHRPDVVVFYDGVNDVSQKCRRELSHTSHIREQRIAGLLKGYSSESTLADVMHPTAKVVDDLAAKFRAEDTTRVYDCDTDPAKAQAVATQLVEDWRMAKTVVESYGGRFVGVLQPVSFIGSPNLTHLNFKRGGAAQYQTVYPLLRQAVAEESWLHDFSGLFDGDEYIYIDFCHVSPNGNEIIAERFHSVVFQ